MKALMRIFVFLMTTLVLFSISAAETWYILPDGSGDAPTIQAGVDSAAVGDTVLLADGTYRGAGNRDVDCDKTIVIRSESGDWSLCKIDCDGTETDPHKGFLFQLEEGSRAALEGVTVTDAWEAGIYCTNGADPAFRDCRITRNHGMGIDCQSSGASFVDCVIDFNSSYGASVESNYLSFLRCEISGNGACGVAAFGPVSASECVFKDNDGCGADAVGYGGYFSNCVFRDNASTAVSFFEADGNVTDCEIFDNDGSGVGIGGVESPSVHVLFGIMAVLV
jgi:hypothetical protein